MDLLSKAWIYIKESPRVMEERDVAHARLLVHRAMSPWTSEDAKNRALAEYERDSTNLMVVSSTCLTIGWLAVGYLALYSTRPMKLRHAIGIICAGGVLGFGGGLRHRQTLSNERRTLYTVLWENTHKTVPTTTTAKKAN